MAKKIGPLVLIICLVTILIFVIGVRYGEKVEKTNKKVDFYLSIAPTKTTPTSPTLEFKTYQHEGCGISFLYPSFLKEGKVSSFSAKLSGQAKFISFNCEKNATAEPTIDPNSQSLEKINPKTDKKILFFLSKSLLSLLEKTLEFNK